MSDATPLLRSLHLPGTRRRPTDAAIVIRPATVHPALTRSRTRHRVRGREPSSVRSSRWPGFALVLSAGSAAVLVRDQYGNFYDAQGRAARRSPRRAGPRAVPRASASTARRTRTSGSGPRCCGCPSSSSSPVRPVASRGCRCSVPSPCSSPAWGMLHWRIRTLLAGTVVSVGARWSSRPRSRWSPGAARPRCSSPAAPGCTTRRSSGASAWSIVAYERLITFTYRPSGMRLLGSGWPPRLRSRRVSLGFGVVGALLLVALGIAVRPTPGTGRRWQRRLGAFAPGDAVDGRHWLAPVLLAILVPVALYAAVNRARFGTRSRCRGSGRSSSSSTPTPRTRSTRTEAPTSASSSRPRRCCSTSAPTRSDTTRCSRG